MSPRSCLALAPEPFVANYSANGALRQQVGEHGRAHIDRPSFFLMLHRSADPATSLARHVAVTSPAYLIWGPEDDHVAASALRAIVATMRKQCEQILLVSLYDQEYSPAAQEDSPRLPPFTALIGAGDDAAATRAAEALGSAMAKVEIDLRRCHVEHRSRPYFEPTVEALVDGDPGISHFSFGLPSIHISPTGTIYPQMFRELSLAAGDALLRAACSFISDGRAAAPVHYRALGRSAILSAALKADRQLDKISRSFDFLLSISPINTDEAMHEFLGAVGGKPPRFQYRPLEVDPDLAKRNLYAIDLAGLEDPLLETLFSEKRRELDHQLTMIGARNTSDFRPASMLQYGVVEPELLNAALAILAVTEGSPRRGATKIGASEIATGARALIDDYARNDERFAAKVEIRDDLAAGLMVAGGTLMISSHTRMARHRLNALLAHEISVHLLTWFNGSTQGLGIFRSGLARYEGVQEGLGVFAEWAVGGLTMARIRLLAGRVVAVDAMLRGADFLESFEQLRQDHGFRPRTAFSIAARVFRSGGFAKDAIYLRGFKAVIDAVASGMPLDPFWIGKIAPDHLAAVEELLQRGLLQPPVFRPEFLDRPDAQARIARLADDSSFDAILNWE